MVGEEDGTLTGVTGFHLVNYRIGQGLGVDYGVSSRSRVQGAESVFVKREIYAQISWCFSFSCSVVVIGI